MVNGQTFARLIEEYGSLEKEEEADAAAAPNKKKEAEAEERKKQSHDMVAESIRRELLESTFVITGIFHIG